MALTLPCARLRFRTKKFIHNCKKSAFAVASPIALRRGRVGNLVDSLRIIASPKVRKSS